MNYSCANFLLHTTYRPEYDYGSNFNFESRKGKIKGEKLNDYGKNNILPFHLLLLFFFFLYSIITVISLFYLFSLSLSLSLLFFLSLSLFLSLSIYNLYIYIYIYINMNININKYIYIYIYIYYRERERKRERGKRERSFSLFHLSTSFLSSHPLQLLHSSLSVCISFCSTVSLFPSLLFRPLLFICLLYLQVLERYADQIRCLWTSSSFPFSYIDLHFIHSC